MPIDIYKNYRRNTAFEMRKKGASYSEIRKEIDVPKSTLTLWFKDLELSEDKKLRLLEKRIAVAKMNGKNRIQNTKNEIERIRNESSRSVKRISKRDFWLIGTILYWRDRMSGSDSMDLRSGVSFTSSNERLLKLFIKWLVDIGKIPIEELSFTLYMNIYSEDKAGKSISNRKDIANSIYDNIEGERDASDKKRFDDSNDDNKINDIASDIHRSINDNEDEININKRIIADESSIDVFKKSSDLISLSTEDKKQISISTWARKLKITASQISHTYITTVKKKKGVRVNIRNTPQNGFIRIRVIKSSMLARQIAGWIEGISQRLEI